MSDESGRTPYIGFSNETLSKLPPIEAGDEIECPQCGEKHQVIRGENSETGAPLDTLLFYGCEDNLYLAGVGGKDVTKVPSDISGSVEF